MLDATIVRAHQLEAGGLIGIGSEGEVLPKSKVKDLENRVRELERVLGKKTLENEILREAVKIARKKTDLATTLARSGRFRIRMICKVLQVARSNIVKRVEMMTTA